MFAADVLTVAVQAWDGIVSFAPIRELSLIRDDLQGPLCCVRRSHRGWIKPISHRRPCSARRTAVSWKQAQSTTANGLGKGGTPYQMVDAD